MKLFLIVLSPALAMADLQINVVYPPKNATIAAADSTFILGSVTPGSELTINGVKIPVHEAGGFIAFLPIKPGPFDFNLTATAGKEMARLTWPVSVPRPEKAPSYDSLYIIDEFDSTRDLVLGTGDRLVAGFRGTPGCLAYFSIPGLSDSIPMAELPPVIQPYRGESVSGQGWIAESFHARGYYEGFLNIGFEKRPDSTRLIYHLVAPDMKKVLQRILNRPAELIDFNFLSLLKLNGAAEIDSSRYYVWVNPNGWPRQVEFIDSMQIIRVGPRLGYLAIFQPLGVTAQAVGAEGEWLKLKLSQTQYGWVNRSSVRMLEPGLPPAISVLKAIRTFTAPDQLLVEMPLSAKHPFRIEEEDSRTILLTLYGVYANTDRIRYDFKDKDLEIATWSQVEPELYQLRLRFKRPIWGYDGYYEGQNFKLKINKAPQPTAGLNDKIIVVDPGHSTDPGAIGPTGLKESEANLKIAISLKDELEKKGARVVLTRSDMSNLPLNERPAIAAANKADLFVSIHNNALPDGINPFINNGVSTYYYHPHSIELARAIQKELPEGTGLNDYGLYYGNLAVNRPTAYPAVLVECAFIIIPEQEALLKTEAFRHHVARAIRDGIENFLREYERQ
jgi:N-acetylmuramoyl-L-alanine amidase